MENILGPQLWPAQAAVEPVGRPVLHDIKSQGRIVSKVDLTAAGVTIPAPATVKEAETVRSLDQEHCQCYHYLSK